MRYFADSKHVKNIDRLIIVYVGLTEDYFTKKFPEFNITQTMYFPSATIREWDKNVLDRVALALRGFVDIHDALATPGPLPVQSEQDKQTRGGGWGGHTTVMFVCHLVTGRNKNSARNIFGKKYNS
jgi:hypothetical protein